MPTPVFPTSTWQKMMASGYRHLPIIDSGELVGIISIKDVLWALTDQRTEPGCPK